MYHPVHLTPVPNKLENVRICILMSKFPIVLQRNFEQTTKLSWPNFSKVLVKWVTFFSRRGPICSTQGSTLKRIDSVISITEVKGVNIFTPNSPSRSLDPAGAVHRTTWEVSSMTELLLLLL